MHCRTKVAHRFFGILQWFWQVLAKKTTTQKPRIVFPGYRLVVDVADDVVSKSCDDAVTTHLKRAQRQEKLGVAVTAVPHQEKKSITDTNDSVRQHQSVLLPDLQQLSRQDHGLKV